MSTKGKEKADGIGSWGKRKRDNGDKIGRRKRKTSGVLQFFEDAAYDVEDDEESEDSDFDDDFLEDEFDTGVGERSEPDKVFHLPLLPKEEEMSEEELEKILEERYKPGSSFVTYAEDMYETKGSVERSTVVPSSKDPTIWKVKCMVGRERHSAFCLMQKYIDLRPLGTKLQIISAFALDHVKGIFYIEADKQGDVYEACKGLCSIYASRMEPVPKNEVSHLLSVRSKYNSISEGMWARVKSGKYKGDLAQVVAVNVARKKTTVRLIPRIDLQALAEKFGGGINATKTAIPAPRLISSGELEEFRPLIQCRRDRDTNLVFEVLDGMMLKDGYLYKKVSLDSLNFWGVMPSDDELLKFEPSKTNEFNDLEWLSRLYRERKKKSTIKIDKGSGKGEGTSSSMENGFEVHDLVFFGRKDFGVVVGSEKDDTFKVLKGGCEGQMLVTVERHDLKSASFDNKLFTALDMNRTTISINDTVRILEGPLKDKQGIVKKIYRGTIFLHDENEQNNSGYFCSKAQTCEKINFSSDPCIEKGGKSGPADFQDFTSSPKSPLSPDKPWQGKDSNRSFNQEKDGMFSIGQSLRIRVGPLKGYLCRVLAVRRSDVTVKLDSQQKILTVKGEHLSEVRGRSSAISMGENSDSVKPFDLLGTQDSTRDWMDGTVPSTSDNWGAAGGLSSERSSWPAFPSSSLSLHPECGSAAPLNSMSSDPKRALEDSSWETKVASSQNPSWGAAMADEKGDPKTEEVGGWGRSEGGWNRPTSAGGGSASGPWGKNHGVINSQDDRWKKSDEPLDEGKKTLRNEPSGWNSLERKKNTDFWGEGKDGGRNESAAPGTQENSWGKAAEKSEDALGWGKGGSSWGKTVASEDKGTGWGNQADTGCKASEKWSNKIEPSENKAVWGSSSAASSSPAERSGNASGSWAQQDAGSNCWKKTEGGSGGLSGNWENVEKDEGAAGWEKGRSGNQCQTDNCYKPKALDSQGVSWGKQGAGSSLGKQDAGSSCGKQDAGSTWVRQDSGSSWNKQDGGSSWNKQDGGSWNKQDGGSWGNKSNWRSENGHGGSECQIDTPGEPRRDGNWRGGRGGFRGRGNSDGIGFGDRGGSRSDTLQGRGGSSNPDHSTYNDFKEGVSTWETKMTSSWNSSRGAAVADVKADANTEVGGWGRSESSLNSTTTGFDGSWGGAKISSGDDAGNKWGKDAAASWGDSNGAISKEEDKWKKSDEPWVKGKNVVEKETSSWKLDEGLDSRTQNDSWRKAASNWRNKDGSDGSKAAWDGSGATPEKHTGGWGNAGASSGQVKDDANVWRKANGDNEDKNENEDVLGDKSENWGKKDGDATGWRKGRFSNQGQTDSGAKQKASDAEGESSWNKQVGGSSWGKQEGGGWGKQDGESSWGKQGGGAWGKQDGVSSWGKQGEGAWGKQDGESSWNKPDGGSWGSKSSWNSGNTLDGSESQADTYRDAGRGGNWRGRGGRGGSDRGGGRSERGGFGGRGWSERGRFRGRGESERGGFRGRGRSDRGGFGGRGCGRRDQSGDWNDRNETIEVKPYSLNKGIDSDAGGWKSNNGGGGWNRDGNKGQWQSWRSGLKSSTGAEGSESTGKAVEWNRDSVKDASGSSWNSVGKNQITSDVSGGGSSSGWTQAVANRDAGGWNRSSWNTVSGLANGGASGTWNQSASDKGQSSSWNQSADTNSGGSEAGQPTGSWDKAAANSWGKRNDGGSKGGW